MSFLDNLRRTKVPSHKEIIALPSKLKQETKNQKLNTVNVRYFDRFFKKYTKTIGIIVRKTSIPIVYIEQPDKLGIILFDDSVYEDSETKELFIDVCEDYPYALNPNCELTQYLNVEYYNDFAENKIAIKKNENDENYLSYKIPLMLNRIPREIIRINTDEQLKAVDAKYVNHKTEITQYLIKQCGNVIMFDRVGKKDNSFLLTGVLVGGCMGTLVGIFITFAFLV